ncbi:hypothetical protein NKJ72_11735 [Mesorhizobium sp. M0045]|uniref:hypothetical protein n=1 Tax=Mesorhizobium sp. M0045 TaxID=2956857 RepID=UPI00333CC199
MIALAPFLAIFGPIWTFATSRVGLPLVVAGGIVFTYEGVPIGPLRYIPYAGPALASLVDGRVDRQYAAGQLNERLVWQEQQRKALAAQTAKAAAEQAELDAISQNYFDKRVLDKVAIASLEDALKAEKEKTDADPKGAGACRVAIPGRVSTQLDAVGR